MSDKIKKKLKAQFIPAKFSKKELVLSILEIQNIKGRDYDYDAAAKRLYQLSQPKLRDILLNMYDISKFKTAADVPVIDSRRNRDKGELDVPIILRPRASGASAVITQKLKELEEARVAETIKIKTKKKRKGTEEEKEAELTEKPPAEHEEDIESELLSKPAEELAKKLQEERGKHTGKNPIVSLPEAEEEQEPFIEASEGFNIFNELINPVGAFEKEEKTFQEKLTDAQTAQQPFDTAEHVRIMRARASMKREMKPKTKKPKTKKTKPKTKKEKIKKNVSLKEWKKQKEKCKLIDKKIKELKKKK